MGIDIAGKRYRAELVVQTHVRPGHEKDKGMSPVPFSKTSLSYRFRSAIVRLPGASVVNGLRDPQGRTGYHDLPG